MNDKFWWYVARSSGIVALVLLVASVVWGVLLATRVLKPHDRPAWLADLHQWLGAMATIMTGLHLVGLVADSYVQFGPADLFVPFASSYRPAAVAVGVVSFYVLIAVEGTSLLRKRLPKRVWRGVHFLSYGLLWTAAVHAGMAGTDVTHRAYQALALLLTLVAVSAAVTRILLPGRAGGRARPVVSR